MKRPAVFLGLFYFVSRILFLLRLPIFNDEAMFLHWGRDVLAGIRPWWFPVLMETKPGFIAALGLIQFLPIDPLIAGRLLSVGFSLISFFITLKTLQLLHPGRSPVTLALLFIFSPFLLLFDRMAVAESGVVLLGSLIFFLTVRFLQRPNVWYGPMIGLLFGLGWWWKSTVLSLIPAVLLIVVWRFYTSGKDKKLVIQAIIWIPTIFFLVISPLFFHPAYRSLPFGEAKAVFTVSELLLFPFPYWQNNFFSATTWLAGYGTPFVFLVSLFGMTRLKRRTVLLPFLFFLTPILTGILFGKLFTARYIVMTVPAMLLLAEDGLVHLVQKYRVSGHMFWITTVGMSAFLSLLLLISPLGFYEVLTPFRKISADFSQYVTGWTSGYGVKEAADWIIRHQSGKPMVVVVREDSGNPEDGIFVYLSEFRGVLITYEPILPEILARKDTPDPASFYFVSRGGQFGGLKDHLTELMRFHKPTGDEFVGIYRIKI